MTTKLTYSRRQARRSGWWWWTEWYNAWPTVVILVSFGLVSVVQVLGYQHPVASRLGDLSLLVGALYFLSFPFLVYVNYRPRSHLSWLVMLVALFVVVAVGNLMPMSHH